ncbi:unnamed protein product [Pleuronectes platessa]|uniref:Uncharacterized protein n=1 Tax=Pleuronectes platessa TaxID=8262 RepID=A0A9N7U611_PLEPL|nr:unnamed protein product [Pleuronectes platessa]
MSGARGGAGEEPGRSRRGAGEPGRSRMMDRGSGPSRCNSVQRSSLIRTCQIKLRDYKLQEKQAAHRPELSGETCRLEAACVSFQSQEVKHPILPEAYGSAVFSSVQSHNVWVNTTFKTNPSRNSS